MSNKVLNISQQVESEYREDEFRDLDTICRFNRNVLYKSQPLSSYSSIMATEQCELSVISDEKDGNRVFELQNRSNPNIEIEQHNKLVSVYEIQRMSDYSAINNSLHNIFNWIPGERVINPEFGSYLRKYLYEGLTDVNKERIASEIRSCVLRWEPRVNVVDIINIGTVEDDEDNTVRLKITYTVPDIDSKYGYTGLHQYVIS